MVVAFFLLKRRERAGRIIFGVMIVIYYGITIEPTAYGISRSLERGVIPPPQEEYAGARAIVILGAGAQKWTEYGMAELDGVSWKRLWRGIELYRTLQGKVPLLYVGGSGDPFNPISQESRLARSYALSMGIPSAHMIIETSSRDTYENGIAVKRILDEQFFDTLRPRIILVTSAAHMPRALAVFQKIGIAVIPAPADFFAGTLELDPLSFVPSASAFSAAVGGIREWIGIVGYKIRGRI